MSESDSTHESWTSAQVDPEPEPHPLFEAISRGDLDAVKRLIAGLPVDCDDLITDTGHDGHTPLELRESVARGGSTCEWKTRGY